MFIGGYLLRFLGAIIIYIYEFVISIATRKNVKSFKDILAAPYDEDITSSVSNELLQKFIGFIFLIVLLFFFVWK